MPLAFFIIITGGLSHGGRLKEYPIIEFMLQMLFYLAILFLLLRAWKGSLPKRPTFFDKLLRTLQFIFGIVLFISSSFLLSEELQIYRGFFTANLIITIISALALLICIVIYNIIRHDSNVDTTHNII